LFKIWPHLIQNTSHSGTVISLDQKKVFNLLIQVLEKSVEQNVY